MSGMNRSGERSLWCAVILAILDDYNLAHTKALKAGRDAAAILVNARMYFESRTGRQRAALAGLTIDPLRAEATIRLPRREFKDRMKADPAAKDDDE